MSNRIILKTFFKIQLRPKRINQEFEMHKYLF